jgi:predicted DNA-binding transcriptional regulator AlpA
MLKTKAGEIIGNVPADDELIDIHEVCREFGGNEPVDRGTVYRAIRRGDFDKPIHPTPGIARWYRSRARAFARRGA